MLFKEWWQSDFTNGKKFVRPDNPFGPSVSFISAPVYIPNREFFRHLDGYGHVGIKSKSASSLAPCCVMKGSEIIHKTWTSGFLYKGETLADLPITPFSNVLNDFRQNRELILLATSYKTNLRNIRGLLDPLGLLGSIYLVKKYYKIFLEFDLIRKLISYFFNEILHFRKLSKHFVSISRFMIRTVFKLFPSNRIFSVSTLKRFVSNVKLRNQLHKLYNYIMKN
jgi:hypothetical protein